MRRMKRHLSLLEADAHSELLHAAGMSEGLILLRGSGSVAKALSQPHLERDIGVVYASTTETQSRCFRADLAPAVRSRDLLRPYDGANVAARGVADDRREPSDICGVAVT